VSIPQVIIDTNVLIAALYSRRGYAFALISRLGDAPFEINISVSLVLEYEGVGKRMLDRLQISEDELEAVIDYLCEIGNQQKIFYLWRPFLKDPGDDMVLELAVAARCEYIVTFNKKDFSGVEEQFGIAIVTPAEFLRRIGVEK
jgi:putative PIN family toxin of toxin-antitoxin system